MILHCFSMPDRLDECLEHGWWISFAGNVTYPKAQDLAEAAERVPLDRLLVETDAPYLTPQAGAQGAQPAGLRRPHRPLRRRAPRHRLRGARGGGRGQRGPAAGLVSELPAQPSLRRMRQFGIRPNRELGQNFLIDSNILDVIAPRRRAGPDDVVLEVGGGLGVLSEYLAERDRARARGRGRPPARAAAARRARPAPERHPAPRRRGQARPRRARPGADQGRRQPAVRRRGDRDPAHDRAAARARRPGWRWCRRRSASGSRRARHARLRRAVGARPARVRREGAPARSRGPCSTRSRTSTPCSSASCARGPAPEPAPARARPAGLRASPQGAGRSVALAGGDRDARARRARGDRPPADARAETLAPDEWRELHGRLADEAALPRPRQGQPVAATSARRAPTACTRSSRSSSRCRSPTS